MNRMGNGLEASINQESERPGLSWVAGYFPSLSKDQYHVIEGRSGQVKTCSCQVKVISGSRAYYPEDKGEKKYT